jgi:aspartate aminotransferase
MSTANGDELQNMKKVASYLIDTCGIAIVPFNAFGASDESEWFRISVGTLAKDEIPRILSHLENGLKQLQKI